MVFVVVLLAGFQGWSFAMRGSSGNLVMHGMFRLLTTIKTGRAAWFIRTTITGLDALSAFFHPPGCTLNIQNCADFIQNCALMKSYFFKFVYPLDLFW